jgi:hypothetical protein
MALTIWMAVAEPSAWGFGWEALVAIGTMLLAGATFVLAWSTRRMAKATAQDVSAQWRPAIAPGEDVEVAYEEERQQLSVTIRNVGRGAAYYLDAGLDFGTAVFPAQGSGPETTMAHNFAVVPVDETRVLNFTHIKERPKECELIIDYSDLTGSRYSTRIVIRELLIFEPKELVRLIMDKVEMQQDVELIPWNLPPTRWWLLRRAVRNWWKKRRQATPPPGPEPF